MKPRVLFLSYDGLTDPLGQSQILPYLFGIANKYAITIVSFEKANRYLQLKDQMKQICGRAGLQWHSLVYHKDPPILSTLYDVWIMKSWVKKLHRESPFSLVHCRSYIPALVGLTMKKKNGVRFVFDMRGFWADERVEGGLWNLKNPLYSGVYKYFKRKERAFFRYADYTIVLTESASRILEKWNIRSAVKVIPCCVDSELFDPFKGSSKKRDRLRSLLGIAMSDFVISYVGSLGTWYLYSEMVHFFDEFKKKEPSAKMLFLTPDTHFVERRKDFIIKTVPRGDVPLYLSLCQASICFILPTFSKQGSSATKMAEAMAMGVPLVVNSGWGDAAQIVHDHSCGVIVNSWSDQEMARAADSLSSDIFEPIKIRKVALDYFSLDEGINRYCEVYNACLD